MNKSVGEAKSSNEVLAVRDLGITYRSPDQVPVKALQGVPFQTQIGEASPALRWLYLLLATLAFVPLDEPSSTSYLILVTVVGALGGARPARLVHGLALSFRRRGCVVAARALGGRRGYLLRVHILPDAIPVLVRKAQLVTEYRQAEVTLSLLSLGINEPFQVGATCWLLQRYSMRVSYLVDVTSSLAPATVSLCCLSISDVMLWRRGVVSL